MTVLQPTILLIGGFAHGERTDSNAAVLKCRKETRAVDEYRWYETVDYFLREVVIDGVLFKFYCYEKLSSAEFFWGIAELLGSRPTGRTSPGTSNPGAQHPVPWMPQPLCDEYPYTSHRGEHGILIGPWGSEILKPAKRRGALNPKVWQKRLLQLKLVASWRDEFDHWADRPQPWEDG